MFQNLNKGNAKTSNKNEIYVKIKTVFKRYSLYFPGRWLNSIKKSSIYVIINCYENAVYIKYKFKFTS